jgi:hypothetical protein
MTTVPNARRFQPLVAALALAAAPGAGRAESFAFLHAGTVHVDAAQGPLRAPEGVACTDAGRFVVADTGNGRLLVYTAKDGKVAGGSELKLPELPIPLRVQIDSKGNVLALDGKSRRIVKVDANGGFGGHVEVRGAAAQPRIGAFKLGPSDEVIALDLAGRIVVLDGEGTVTREIPVKPGLMITDVAVDSNGVIYALDPIGGTLWTVERGATELKPLVRGLQDRMSFGMYVTTWQGRIFLVDQNGSGLVILGPDGSYLGRRLSIGWSDGLVNYPGQLCFQGSGLAVLADRFNNRVQLFNVQP